MKELNLATVGKRNNSQTGDKQDCVLAYDNETGIYSYYCASLGCATMTLGRAKKALEWCEQYIHGFEHNGVLNIDFAK